MGTCQGCHGPELTAINFPLMDYNGDGVVEGVQTEVRHLLDQLALMLPPVGRAMSSPLLIRVGHNRSWKRPTTTSLCEAMAAPAFTTTAYKVGLLKASLANLQSK